MASTDIDGTPIVVLSALEAEHVVAIMEDNDAVNTTLLRKLRKFLDEPAVAKHLERDDET